MKTIILILSLMTTLIYSSGVKATVNQKSIIKGMTIQLTLKATGDDIKFPDIQSIGDYPIEGISSRSSSSIKMINGNTTQEVSKEKILSFTPDKNVTIPPFDIVIDGTKFQTNSIKITVNSASSYSPKGDEKFTLEMSSKKREVFVGEPFLLSIYFGELKGVSLMDFRSKHPNFKSAIAKEIKGEQTYQKGNYIVHQFNYILTPTEEGKLDIEPMIARVAERSESRDNFFGTIFDKPKWSQVISNSLTIDVKPIPTQTALIGDFTINNNIDSRSVKANKPINLTINIKGEGSLEEFDELNYEIDGVTIYSDDAVVSTKLEGNKLISNYTKKFVFISDQNFTIPSKSFTAFNFRTQKEYSLDIDSYRIEVKGKAIGSAMVISSPKEDTNSTIKEESIVNSDSNQQKSNSILIAILSFIFGVIITFISLKFDRIKSFKFNSSPYRESEALKILYPHINSSRDIESMVRDLYNKESGDKSIKIDKRILREMVDRVIT